MKRNLHRLCAILFFISLLSLSGCEKPQTGQFSTVTEPLLSPVDAAPETIAAFSENAPLDGSSEAPAVQDAASTSASFQTPCIEGPYDYEHLAEDKQIVIRRFQENGITFFIADIQLTDPAQFQTALSEDKPFGKLEPVSAMAERNNAVFAINADDYGIHKYGTIIRNGTLIRTHDTTRNMLIVDANGDFSIRVDRADEDPELLGQTLQAEGTWQTFEFGPELIRDGQAVEFSSAFDVISTKPGRREPRTAIGQIGPLHYAVIVADGRQNGYSKGMTLSELQKLFIQCGAHTAMNLDGGGSAEMWFDGEVINQPSEGKERRLSDILFF